MVKLAGILSSFIFASAVLAETVYFDPKTDPGINFAAKDLARCLSSATGKSYETGQNAATAVPGDIILKIEPSLESQQWHFKTSDGKLFISGRDAMGIVYGIYTFLEKYAGCSWFAPDTELVPLNKDWKLPVLDEKGKPAFSRREMYVGYDFMDGTWRLRNKESFRASYGIGMAEGSPRGCHTFDIYVKAVKDSALFGPARAGGRSQTLCMTSPDVRKIIISELEKYIQADRKRLAGKPSYMYPTIYDISQPDGGSGGECWCSGCRKLAENEGSYSGPNVAFVNALAAAIKDKYPEICLRTFAYSYTLVPPRTVKAADNVVIQFTKSYLFDPLIPGTENAKALEAWKKHTDNMSVWAYWRVYQGTVYPYVKKRKDIAEELRFCHNNKVMHYFAENEDPLSRSFAMLQHYLMLKMLDNPDQDINAISEKFMKSYYGKAAPVMTSYLDYLEKRQEDTRTFLDRAFFEKTNAWFDKAEELASDDPASLRHIHWERIVVDRSLFLNLANLKKNGYSPDLKKITGRFRKNVIEQILNWNYWNFNKEMKSKRLEQAKNEAALYEHFPVDVPNQFDGCEVVDLHWNQISIDKAEYVNDADAICGTAFKNGGLSPNIPFSVGFYNGSSKSGDGITFSAPDIPQDEKFHLYKLGKTVIMSPLYLYFDRTWTFRSYLPTLGIIPETREIWVSMKFAGPFYVKGSKSDNAVLFDRILLVKNENPLRCYEPVDPQKNFVKNGGFELNSTTWIPDWGKPSQYHGADKNEKHSGNFSIKIGEVAKTYDYFATGLGKIQDMKNDFLIRGWCKYKDLRQDSNSQLPFIGIWTSTSKGANSYTLPIAPFYPGSRDWFQFETVLKADEFKKKIERQPESSRPLTFAFRVNLCNQPGTVWVDDIEVIPLEKKADKKPK